MAGRAFMHALALALNSRAELTLLHAGRSRKGVEHKSFPSVRQVLRSWNILSDQHDITEAFRRLGLVVRKVNLHDSNPIHSIPEYIQKHPSDLMVIATRGDEKARFAHRRSIAEPISRYSKVNTIFVPGHIQGFVSPLNGQIRVRKILVPVDQQIGSRKAVETAVEFVRNYCEKGAEIIRLFVGTDVDAPQIEIPEDLAGPYIKTTGNVASAVVQTANESSVDLVVIGVDYSSGGFGSSRGSIIRKTIHRSPCPTLTVLP